MSAEQTKSDIYLNHSFQYVIIGLGKPELTPVEMEPIPMRLAPSAKQELYAIMSLEAHDFNRGRMSRHFLCYL